MKQDRQATKKRHFPLFAWIFYGVAAAGLAVYLICLASVPFADFVNRYIGSAVRGIMAYVTGWIPFSLAEYLLLLVPLILVCLSVYGIRRYSDSWRAVFVYCGSMLSVGALVFGIFALGFAPAYRGSSLDKKLGIERRGVSAEELYEVACILADRLDEESEKVSYFETDRFSVMPYGYGEMNDLLLEAYDTVCDEHAFVQRLNSRLKPVMLSEAMSYTHITGVYTFFTGEANINVAFPDYTIPFTAAHELSHQRGIAREDEANFMAFLVCIASEDDYIRYSGYLNLYEYVASALYSASPALYGQVASRLPADVRREMVAYSEFFEKYRESTASEVSETVNNTFLTMHGTEGVKSYGMVVDLAVAYYLPS